LRLSGDRERLLAQHVLARVQRLDRPLGVHGHRKRNVYGVHDVGLEKRLVRPEALVEIEGVRELSRPITVPACHRDEAVTLDRRVAYTTSLPILAVDSSPQRTLVTGRLSHPSG
jgi:hypothetical protein